MLMVEWNMDDALAVRYEEGVEDGLEKGIEIGVEKGIEIGVEKGKQELQKYVLELIAQGLSSEEIKKRLEAGVSR
ncbi:MAG: hypothetical protein FWG77_09755 [Treponema sp.]|nr:hypothetical protein [Treponema sp.]